MSSESLGPDINIGGRALGAIWSLNALAIIIVIARCLTQRLVSRQLGLSDALVVVSMCTISSMAALITVQYHYGWGRHYAYLDVEDRVEAMKYNAIGQSFGEIYIY
ncbi:integral membrane protein [Rutstroemia sp. NJR-2017a BBW]|nr:integral membrane protein [Rutstroemia sp. NJR-2017a BBW]